MPLAFSNKVQKPPLDFKSLFGTAQTTPAFSGTTMQNMAKPLVTLANLPPKAPAPAASVARTAPQAAPAPMPAAQNQNAVRGLLPTPIPAQAAELPGKGRPAPAAPAQGASPTFSGIIFDLIKRATEGDKNVQKAREDLTKFQTGTSQKIADIKSDPIPLEFQQGRAQVVQQASAEKEAALQTGVANALAAQQQGLGAMTSAAGLAAPSPSAFGQTTFNPLEGGFEGDGGLPPAVMSQYAQMAANGQYSAIPSFITSNPVLNAQLNVAAKAFNPNFNPIQAAGASGVLGSIPALQSAETAADGIKNTIISYLGANPQLNPSDLAVGNKLQQWIEGKQLTDPKYQTLFNYLNEYTNTLAPILGVGGDTTNLKTQIAQSFINAAASGQSITEVLEALSQLASNKVIDLQRGAVGQGTSVPEAGSAGGFAEAW